MNVRNTETIRSYCLDLIRQQAGQPAGGRGPQRTGVFAVARQ